MSDFDGGPITISFVLLKLTSFIGPISCYQPKHNVVVSEIPGQNLIFCLISDVVSDVV